jgi:hypothetical protein
MNCYYDNNYGADADGRRGMGVWEYELGPEDDDEVIGQLVEQFIDLEFVEFPEVAYITMINPVTEDDVKIMVYTEAYGDRVWNAMDHNTD